jgi:hypothetical protein
MNQPPQTGKRIVSKTKYIEVQLKRLMCIALAVCLVPCCYYLSTFIVKSSMHIQYHINAHNFMPLMYLLSATGGVAGVSLLNKARKIVPVVPITRANTGHLPAQESLVRASEEPTRPAVPVWVLRAATESVERHEEQLVRAAGGME